MKLKIALIIDKFDYRMGGAERYARDLAEGLVREGHEIHVFCRRGQSSREGIVVHLIPAITYPKYLRLLTFVRGVRKHLNKDDFDIVHGLGYNPGVTVLNPHTGVEQSWIEGDDQSRESSAALLWARLVRFLTPRRHLILSLQRRQYRDSGVRAVIAISEKVKSDMMRFHPVDDDRIEVINNGIDIQRFNPKNRDRYREAARNKLGLATDEILILTVTNNFRLKGIYPAVRMLPALMKRVKVPFRLLIVGRDDSGPYQRQAERLAVSDRVVFMNYVEDVAPLYAAADIFFLPTFYDSFALVALEAIASGLPVVTTKNAGAAAVIESRDMGWVVDDPRDHEALAEALSYYFSREAQTKAYAAAGKIYTRFSSTENIRRIQEVYRRVLSQRQG
ncbi:MAG: glycosyltransferase family 4 protein [Deltaproteobacteria bacterium]|nr:glycosyltransferase family 4 protein [Candidatus Zymogenaceae bacterium]